MCTGHRVMVRVYVLQAISILYQKPPNFADWFITLFDNSARTNAKIN